MREVVRRFYYALFSGRVIRLTTPAVLAGYRWIIDAKEGMAYRKGYYEPPLTSLLLNHLTPDAVFFDLGAHVGYFSLLAAAASPQGAVHSFEPDEANFAYCQSIKALNGLAYWTVNRQAVGVQTETRRFRKGHTTTTGQVDERGDTVIEVVSLDDYVHQWQLTRLDLIKIDVEGFGGNVLKGATTTLTRLKPTILMEFHEGYDEWAVFHDLVAPHYQVFDMDNQRLVDVRFARPHFVYAVPN